MSSNSAHIVTDKPDELHNPLMVTPLSLPEDILPPVMVNMHAEERQGRKIAWIMDDLNRDIAKLRVIFVERLTEPTEKVPDTWKSKLAPDKSHEILKNLTSISEWLAQINIDGESFTLPIVEEDMKIAQEKPMDRKAFIEEHSLKLQKVIEGVVEKTLKLTKFIAGRQNVLDKFCEYLGDTPGVHKDVTIRESAGLDNILASLKTAELENYEEVEKFMYQYEESLMQERDKILRLRYKIMNMGDELEKYKELQNTVTNVKAMTFKFIKETETTLAKVISDEGVRMDISLAFTSFKNNFHKQLNSVTLNKPTKASSRRLRKSKSTYSKYKKTI